jgi:L-phenylalanine/L-methionine N-acetyltransferase
MDNTTRTTTPAHQADARVAQKQRVTIRAAEPSDAAPSSALIGSDGVFAGTLQMPYAAVASRVERFSKMDPHCVQLVAVARDSDNGAEQVVGHAGLFTTSTSPRRMHARGLGIAVAAAWQGQGVGDQLIHALLDWADNWAGVLRIELNVYTDNTRAIALYERHGFVREGLMRTMALKDGVYANSLAMARFHPRPPTLPAIYSA